MRSGLRSLGLAVVVLASTAPTSQATTFFADRFDDPATGGTACTPAPNDCSLSGALSDSFTNPGPDVVQLSVGEYNLPNAGTASPVTIIGGGARNTIIHFSHAPGFEADEAGAVELRDLTLTGAHGGGPFFGGGIFLQSKTNLILRRVAIVGNTTSGDPEQTGQKYPGRGGAIQVNAVETTLVIDESLIADNTAFAGSTGTVGLGGGIAFITNATTSAVIRNSTIADNEAAGSSTAPGMGGGIYIGGGSLELDHVTLAGNTASGGKSTGTEGGNLWRDASSNVKVRSSIIALGSAPQHANCNLSTSSFGGNVEDSGECGFGSQDRVGVNPLLGPLANNGGPTDTRALGAGSPAVNLSGACGLGADQRGVPRSDGQCDSGAYEFVGSPSLLSPIAILGATHTPPTLSGASQSHSTWSEGGKLAAFARKGKAKAPVGTTFSFRLDQPAAVRFTFTQRVGGRKVNGRCVAQTKRNRHRRPCKRTVTRGTLTFVGHIATNKLDFQGRISRSKKLPLGRYTLTIVATNSAGQRSGARSLQFTIVK